MGKWANRGVMQGLMYVPSVFGVSIDRNLGAAQLRQFVYSFSEHVLHVDSHALHIKSEASLYSPIALAHAASQVSVALFP